VILVFLTVLIPIFSITIYINLFGSNYIKKQISNSMLSEVEFYAKGFESEIGRIKIQQWQLLQDEDLNKLGIASDMMAPFERIQAMKRVSTRLRTIKNSSDYIENQGVYINGLKKTISTEEGVRDIPNSESAFLETYLKSNESEMFYKYKEELYLVIFLPENHGSELALSKYAAYVQLSESKIREILSQLETSYNAYALIINSSKGWTISTGANRNIEENIIRYLQNNTGNRKGLVGKEKIDNRNYLVVCYNMEFFNMDLYLYVAEDNVIGPLRLYNYLFAALIAVSLIIIVTFSFLLNGMIHKPLINLVNAFKMLEAENLNLVSYHKKNDEFEYLYKGFNNMVERLKKSLNQVFQQKIAAQQAELKQLQSQINPHFLYNSFFHIYLMCKNGNYDNVAQFSQKLSSYFQFITRSGVDEVPFHMELKHARNYTDIQTIRFGKRIRVEYGEIPEESRNIKVPKLTLQPLIENAYVHGLKNTVKDGIICIDVSFRNNILTVSVEDNGEGLEDHQLEELQRKLNHTDAQVEKTGIFNVNKRIRLKFGDDSGLKVSRGRFGGLKVEAIIIYKGVENSVSSFDSR